MTTPPQPLRLILVDLSADLVAAWGEAFEEEEGVEVHRSDLFEHPADAMVSPANSFGTMDGGLDKAIRDTLGFSVEKRAQKAIVDLHHGELPIGAAVVVASDEPRWPWLIVAPTMRVPEPVGQTLNAYLAFRAAVLAARRHQPAISSLVCPGLCTGIGTMDARRCAAQMRVAWRQATGPARIPSFDHIHKVHRALRTS